MLRSTDRGTPGALTAQASGAELGLANESQKGAADPDLDSEEDQASDSQEKAPDWD